jgi:predicted secreted protein
MAALIGKDGSLRIGTNVIGAIDTWSLNLSQGSAEITALSTEANTFRNYVQTIKEWSGSASGTLDLADSQQLTVEQSATTGTFAVAALRFYTTLAAYWAGNAYITGITVNSRVDDKVSLSFNFQGTGAIAYTSS